MREAKLPEPRIEYACSIPTNEQGAVPREVMIDLETTGRIARLRVFSFWFSKCATEGCRGSVLIDDSSYKVLLQEECKLRDLGQPTPPFNTQHTRDI